MCKVFKNFVGNNISKNRFDATVITAEAYPAEGGAFQYYCRMKKLKSGLAQCVLEAHYPAFGNALLAVHPFLSVVICIMSVKRLPELQR